MKIIATHAIVTDSGKAGIFNELEDGRFIYLHHKLQPRVIERKLFEKCEKNSVLPQISSLT